MRIRSLCKLGCFISILTLACIISGNKITNAGTVTGEKPVAGVSYYLDMYYKSTEDLEGASGMLLADRVSIPDNVAIANVNDYLNIRSGAGIDYGMIGYLPKDGMCIVLEELDGWAKIQSGSVTGYVSTDYLFMGEEGRAKAEEIARLMATVEAGSVNFRSEPDTSRDDNVIATVSRGEHLVVIEETIVSKDDANILWVKAYVDDLEGYVSKEFVSVGYDWVKAVSISSILDAGNSSGVSSLRASMVIEAKKHLGLRYVWGGMSLSKGADCSGFCLAVYKACGIDINKLPRASYDLASSSKGRKISLANAKPGDLVFYGDSSGHVNHVAMYIGNGQIIHESGRAYGCKISDVNYRTVLKVKNFLD